MEVRDHHLVLMTVERLLKRMIFFLNQIDGATDQLTILLLHHKQADTRISLQLREPQRNLLTLNNLVRTRFQRLQITAPVYAIRLQATQIQAFMPQTASLFAHALMEEGASQDAEQASVYQHQWQAMLDELSAYLGKDRWSYLQTKADHRPECAWEYTQQLGISAVGLRQYRPFYLLANAIALTVRHDQLFWETRLTVLSGPERVETGWWDHGSVMRDYYFAVDGYGRYCWIYRDLTLPDQSAQWYLHGLYS